MNLAAFNCSSYYRILNITLLSILDVLFKYVYEITKISGDAFLIDPIVTVKLKNA